MKKGAMKDQPAIKYTKEYDTDSRNPWKIEYYKQADLVTSLHFQDIKEKATRIWLELSLQREKEVGDRGCCTIGGGIYMYTLPPRHSKPKRIRIIAPPNGVQGEDPKYCGMKEAVAFLELHGYKTQGDHGRMD
jgi:hypothetical protein